MTDLCNSRARLLHNKPKALQDSDWLWASVLHGYLSLEVGERRGFIPDKTLENVIADRLTACDERRRIESRVARVAGAAGAAGHHTVGTHVRTH
jgi:hypothetical protein